MSEAMRHTGRAAERCFPDDEQTLLLRAALWPGDEARGAWRELRARTDLESLDSDSHRVLPMLYRNLVALGVEDPDLPRLKGVYRHYWAANQLHVNDAVIAVRALASAGIATLVLKGVALTTLHYCDTGIRPMEDADVVVPLDRAREALTVLDELGYRRRDERLPLGREMATRHAASLRRPPKGDIDLHWYALLQSTGDEDFWDASVPVRLGDAVTRMLCPTDQLLHVCVHGLTGPALRWIPDALAVLRSSEQAIDWSRLVERGIARRLTLPLAEALGHLAARWRVDVPDEVLGRLWAVRPSASERWGHRAAVRPPRHGTLYLRQWDRHRRLRRASAPEAARTFAGYMCDYWDLDGQLDLTARLARKAVQLARHGRSEATGLPLGRAPATP